MTSSNWTIRIFKAWNTNDISRAWVNNYEINTPTAMAPTDLVPVLNTLVAAEKALHLTQVTFISGTISTWENEPGSYDPLSFVTVPQSGNGSLPLGTSQAMDSNVCFMVKYQPDTGRTGRRFYRGVVTEADIDATSSGYWQIVAGSGLLDAGSSMNSFRTALAPLLPGGNGIGKLMLMYAKVGSPSVQRAVTSVHGGSVTINKRNHRYFDRAGVR